MYVLTAIRFIRVSRKSWIPVVELTDLTSALDRGVQLENLLDRFSRFDTLPLISVSKNGLVIDGAFLCMNHICYDVCLAPSANCSA